MRQGGRTAAKLPSKLIDSNDALHGKPKCLRVPGPLFEQPIMAIGSIQVKRPRHLATKVAVPHSGTRGPRGPLPGSLQRQVCGAGAFALAVSLPWCCCITCLFSIASA